jgi:hypothetical protein
MRTRHVYSHDMVAHLWAHQSQDSARTANGNFFFTGDTIYSYGHHFPIARHVGGVVLFTTRGYSVTTAGHKGHVESTFAPTTRNTWRTIAPESKMKS